jgi:hypothetical protein
MTDLRPILSLLLDHIDYTNGACRVNEQIGAVLPVGILAADSCCARMWAVGQTFKLLDDGRAIQCLRCGLTSHNPNDVRELYCGACHAFHTPQMPPPPVDVGEQWR